MVVGEQGEKYMEISAEEFRQKLAGHKGRSDEESDVATQSIRHECVNFLAILPKLFGDSLDRKTLWERIHSGIITSITKSEKDFEAFVNFLLQHIVAEPAMVASNTQLSQFITLANTRGKEWREDFMRTLELKSFVLIVLAREKWENVKQLNKGDK